MSQQLTLPIQLRDDATFANFYIEKNVILIKALQAFILEPFQHYIYLWGHSGAGCTHLLQACCHLADKHALRTAYLPMIELINLNSNLFDDLEQLELIAIDNIEVIANHQTWQEALFHLFNRCKANKTRLLMTANNIPQGLNLTLPDLISRLNSGLLFQVQELSDEAKLAALQMRAQLRGIELNNEVGKYLLTHHSRHLNDLFILLEKLDHLSLAEQRKLTIPFVKTVLKSGLIA